MFPCSAQDKKRVRVAVGTEATSFGEKGLDRVSVVWKGPEY